MFDLRKGNKTNKSECAVVGKKNELELAKIDIGRSNFIKNRKLVSAWKIAIGACVSSLHIMKTANK